jgi:hypothetical protein
MHLAGKRKSDGPVRDSLSRIWVHLVPRGVGCYLHSLNACLLDERVVASEITTLEWIASAIRWEDFAVVLSFAFSRELDHRVPFANVGGSFAGTKVAPKSPSKMTNR